MGSYRSAAITSGSSQSLETRRRISNTWQTKTAQACRRLARGTTRSRGENMDEIEHILFVYKNKTTNKILCKFLDDAKLIDLTQYDHVATLNPQMFIEHWWEDIKRLEKEME
jgi:hypothetical protein